MSNYSNSYKHAGLLFRMIQRTENVVMFEGVSKSGWKQWEVHVLRMKKAHPSSPEAGKKILSKPSTSEWGKYGFTYQSLERAQEKMDALVKAKAGRPKPSKPIANEEIKPPSVEVRRRVKAEEFPRGLVQALARKRLTKIDVMPPIAIR